jgi:hypothetical protein
VENNIQAIRNLLGKNPQIPLGTPIPPIPTTRPSSLSTFSDIALNTIESLDDFDDDNDINEDSGTGIEDYYQDYEDNALDLRDVLYPDDRSTPADYAFFHADDGGQADPGVSGGKKKKKRHHQLWWEADKVKEEKREQLDYTLTPSFEPLAGGLLQFRDAKDLFYVLGHAKKSPNSGCAGKTFLTEPYFLGLFAKLLVIL